MAAPKLTSLPMLLRLYVAGKAPNSVRAIANVQSLCSQHFDSHEIEIVDLLVHPLRALADKVIVTPTLLRLSPLPVVRVIGTLNDTDQVLGALAGP